MYMHWNFSESFFALMLVWANSGAHDFVELKIELQ